MDASKHKIQSILHISDTHGEHHQLKDLPQADIIIHSGDAAMAGAQKEIFEFLEWFMDLPYPYKVYVPGNHDDCLLNADNIEGLDDNCFFLSNSGVTIDGLKIYGVPCFMEHAVSGKTPLLMAKIPKDTDILVTHQPPYGILDKTSKRHYGSESLLQRVCEIKPRLHLFGHIHGAYGSLENQDTLFYNSSLMDERYNLVHSPQLIMLQR